MELVLLNCNSLKDTALYAALYQNMPPERQQKADACRRESDKLLSLGGGLVLRHLLRDYNSARICTEKNGKPYLPGNPIYFNMSHSGEWVLGVSAHCPVGCDIQEIRTVNDKVPARFFTESERQMLDACENETAYAHLFYRLWALKESAVKATGEGVARLEQMEIRFENDVAQPITLPDGTMLHLREFALDLPYTAAVCTVGDNAELAESKIEIITP